MIPPPQLCHHHSSVTTTTPSSRAKLILSLRMDQRSRGTLCSTAPPQPSSGVRPVWVGHSCPKLLIRIRARLQSCRTRRKTPQASAAEVCAKCASPLCHPDHVTIFSPHPPQLCHPPQTLSSRAKLMLSLRTDQRSRGTCCSDGAATAIIGSHAPCGACPERSRRVGHSRPTLLVRIGHDFGRAKLVEKHPRLQLLRKSSAKQAAI